jgi:hypothetical protein
VWYVRRDKGPRIRIRAEYGTPEFEVEYQAALAGTPPPRKQGPNAGSLAWLIARHRETTEWAVLSVATRRQRENIFEQVVQSAGDQPFTKITTSTIMAGRERRAKTPAQARNFLDAMRGLFRWAAKAQMVKSDRHCTSRIRRAQRAPASSRGLRITLPSMSGAGPSGRASGSGSTFCFTLGCAAAMPFASGASTSAMALER